MPPPKFRASASGRCPRLGPLPGGCPSAASRRRPARRPTTATAAAPGEREGGLSPQARSVLGLVGSGLAVLLLFILLVWGVSAALHAFQYQNKQRAANHLARDGQRALGGGRPGRGGGGLRERRSASRPATATPPGRRRRAGRRCTSRAASAPTRRTTPTPRGRPTRRGHQAPGRQERPGPRREGPVALPPGEPAGGRAEWEAAMQADPTSPPSPPTPAPTPPMSTRTSPSRRPAPATSPWPAPTGARSADQPRQPGRPRRPRQHQRLPRPHPVPIAVGQSALLALHCFTVKSPALRDGGPGTGSSGCHCGVCALISWWVRTPAPMADRVGWRSAKLSFLPCILAFRAATLSAWWVATAGGGTGQGRVALDGVVLGLKRAANGQGQGRRQKRQQSVMVVRVFMIWGSTSTPHSTHV